jgi:hypothetical protein
MAKPNSKGRNASKFVGGLTHSMVDSPAFRALSPNAVALFVHMLRRYNSFNNGDIVFSCREASKLLHIGKDTAGRAFDDLMEKGFIGIGRDSSFTLKSKESRRWILTCWPLKQNIAPTHDWRAWKPDI